MIALRRLIVIAAAHRTRRLLAPHRHHVAEGSSRCAPVAFGRRENDVMTEPNLVGRLLMAAA